MFSRKKLFPQREHGLRASPQNPNELVMQDGASDFWKKLKSHRTIIVFGFFVCFCLFFALFFYF